MGIVQGKTLATCHKVSRLLGSGWLLYVLYKESFNHKNETRMRNNEVFSAFL